MRRHDHLAVDVVPGLHRAHCVAGPATGAIQADQRAVAAPGEQQRLNRGSIWRVAALNISLLPVAVLSLFTMANDFLTGRKRAFDRTPRRGETTSLSVQYRIVATLMVMAVFWRALPSRMWSLADAAPALINVGLLLAGWYLARGGPIPIEGVGYPEQ